jgi:hypothetical protein
VADFRRRVVREPMDELMRGIGFAAIGNEVCPEDSLHYGQIGSHPNKGFKSIYDWALEVRILL